MAPQFLQRTRYGVFRAVLISLAAAAVLYLTAVVTVAGIFRSDNPSLALRLAPFDSRARSYAASQIIKTNQSPAAVNRARALSVAALARDPTNVVAVRTLGLVEGISGEEAKTGRLFGYAEQLSRRDLGTQLWLLDKDVRDGNVAGALHHYDVALRTSREASRLLFPILLAASQDPQIAEPLADILLTRPPWLKPFIAELIYKGQSLPQVVRLTSPFLDTGTPEGREASKILVDRLTRENRFDLLWALYQSHIASEAEEGRALVRNGDFSHPNDMPPFDWVLIENQSIAATAQLRDEESGMALFLTASGGRGGEVARQLLRLRGGPFQLSARMGDIPADSFKRPRIVVRCAAGGPELLKLLPPPVDGEGKTVSGKFVIPGEGCSTQWLAVELPGGLERRAPSWIDDIKIISGSR